MLLYLSSYKLGDRKDVLKKWILENGNKIILISNSKDWRIDCDEKEQGIKKNVADLEEVGFDVKRIDLRNYFGKKEQLEKDLEGYFAFYVLGGNVFILRKAMQLSGFDEYILKKQNDDKYLYAGYSAGICVLGPSLYGLDIVDKPINPYNEEEVLYGGLNILDFMPIPHYKSNHPESKLIDEEVKFLKENKIKYKTLQDGDVIIKKLKIGGDMYGKKIKISSSNYRI